MTSLLAEPLGRYPSMAKFPRVFDSERHIEFGGPFC
jgi:hypothetical protein